MHDITEHLHFDFSLRLPYNTIGIGISPISSLNKKEPTRFQHKVIFWSSRSFIYTHKMLF